MNTERQSVPLLGARQAQPVAGTTPLATLTRLNTNDFLAALGLERLRRGRSLLELLCRAPARRFANQVVTYDTIVGREGLQAGHAWLLRQFVANVEVRGAEQVPPAGPVMVVANHPGLTDTSLLLASTPRSDMRIIAGDRPFLRALVHTERYLFYLAEGRSGQVGLIRAVTRHLRAGGGLLVYLGGTIEPDPATLPGAIEALENWSASTELFARLVGNLT